MLSEREGDESIKSKEWSIEERGVVEDDDCFALRGRKDENAPMILDARGEKEVEQASKDKDRIEMGETWRMVASRWGRKMKMHCSC